MGMFLWTGVIRYKLIAHGPEWAGCEPVLVRKLFSGTSECLLLDL